MTATDNDIDTIGPAGTELARYQTSTCERVLMGWRREGGVEVTDRPVEGRHRAYLVDRGFRCFEQLAAFVGDYVDQARRLDRCPMGESAIAAILDDSDSEALQQLLGEGV